jgi:hypothetical protein
MGEGRIVQRHDCQFCGSLMRPKRRSKDECGAKYDANTTISHVHLQSFNQMLLICFARDGKIATMEVVGGLVPSKISVPVFRFGTDR